MSLLGWLFHSADLAHYKQGIAHFNAGDYEKAIAALEAALESSSGDKGAYYHLERFYAAEAHGRLGEALLADNDFEHAGQELEQAIALGQSFPDRLAMLAHIRRLGGDVSSAVTLLTQALALNPAYRSARAERALCYDALGQSENAWSDIATLGKQGPLPAGLETFPAEGSLPDALRAWLARTVDERQEPKRRIRLAESYEARGEPVRALAELESLASDYPDYPDVRLRLAVLLHRAGRLEPARQHLHHAVAINPRYADAYVHLGILSLKEGHPGEARRHFERAKTHAPAHPSLPLLVALAHLRAGAWGEARTIVEAAKEGPQDKTFGLLGLLSWAEGDEDAAREFLLAAIEIHPGLAWAARAYASLARTRDELESARRALETALKLHPHDTPLRLTLTQILLKSGRPDLARDTLDEALTDEPHHPVALGWKGRLLADEHAYAEAEPLLRQAVSAERAGAGFWQVLGRVLMRQGKLPEATTVLTLAVERGMTAPQAALDLALSYFRQSRPSEGIKALARLQAPDADHPLAQMLASPAFVDEL